MFSVNSMLQVLSNFSYLMFSKFVNLNSETRVTLFVSIEHLHRVRPCVTIWGATDPAIAAIEGGAVVAEVPQLNSDGPKKVLTYLLVYIKLHTKPTKSCRNAVILLISKYT